MDGFLLRLQSLVLEEIEGILEKNEIIVLPGGKNSIRFFEQISLGFLGLGYQLGIKLCHYFNKIIYIEIILSRVTSRILL